MIPPKAKRALVSLATLVALIGLFTVAQGAGLISGSGGSKTAATSFERAVIVRVVDGDTLVVDRGGGDEKVRLIGIDCPESVNSNELKNTEEGRAASDFTKGVVSKGQAVWLQKDISDTDKYGRLLRYVWLSEPEDAGNANEVEDYMLNAVLVANGHAIAKEYRPDTAYTAIFKDIETKRSSVA